MRREYIDSLGRVRKGYTDLFVILGHNRREVNETYREIERRYPEMLLGYDVLLSTPNDRLEGLRVHEFCVTPYAWEHPKIHHAVDMLAHSKLLYSLPPEGVLHD